MQDQLTTVLYTIIVNVPTMYININKERGSYVATSSEHRHTQGENITFVVVVRVITQTLRGHVWHTSGSFSCEVAHSGRSELALPRSLILILLPFKRMFRGVKSHWRLWGWWR